MCVCMYVRHHFKEDQRCSESSQTPITIHILKAHDDSYSRIRIERKYKDKDNGKDDDKTKTQTTYLKQPTGAIFLES